MGPRTAVAATVAALALLATALLAPPRAPDAAALRAECGGFLDRAGPLLDPGAALETRKESALLGMSADDASAFRSRMVAFGTARLRFDAAARESRADVTRLRRGLRDLREEAAKARMLLAPYRARMRDELGEERTREIFGEAPGADSP